MNISIDPEILEIVRSSAAVSTQKGNSVHLLKIGAKRRRTRAEIDEYKAIRERELESLADKDQIIEHL